jgi:perosamine synthetase
MFEKASLMRDYGIDRGRFRGGRGGISPKCDIPIRGYGAMMGELSGSIWCRQLQLVDSLLSQQRENAEIFSSATDASRPYECLSAVEVANASYWVFTLLSNKSEEILAAMRKRGIWASKVHSRNDLYSCFGGGSRTELRGVTEFASRQVSIPSGWWVTADERETIIQALQPICRKG